MVKTDGIFMLLMVATLISAAEIAAAETLTPERTIDLAVASMAAYAQSQPATPSHEEASSVADVVRCG
jgi:hypothetical protein